MAGRCLLGHGGTPRGSALVRLLQRGIHPSVEPALEAAGVSDCRIVAARRGGSKMYRGADACVTALPELVLCLAEDAQAARAAA